MLQEYRQRGDLVTLSSATMKAVLSGHESPIVTPGMLSLHFNRLTDFTDPEVCMKQLRTNSTEEAYFNRNRSQSLVIFPFTLLPLETEELHVPQSSCCAVLRA